MHARALTRIVAHSLRMYRMPRRLVMHSVDRRGGSLPYIQNRLQNLTRRGRAERRSKRTILRAGPCRAMSGRVGLCRAMSGYVGRCRTESGYVSPCGTVSGCVESCQATSGPRRTVSDYSGHILSKPSIGSDRVYIASYPLTTIDRSYASTRSAYID